VASDDTITPVFDDPTGIAGWRVTSEAFGSYKPYGFDGVTLTPRTLAKAPAPQEPRAILLNGPPRSGKDTAAGYIARVWAATPFKVSQPLKDAIAALFGWTPAQAEEAERLKDVARAETLGTTYRKLQIALSESGLKTWTGDDRAFGKLAVRRIQAAVLDGGDDLFVCSDAGFGPEVDEIVQCLHADRVLMIHLYRDGCTFDNDSRDYVFPRYVETVRLENNGSESDLFCELTDLVDEWLRRTEA
jgi:hypothetical protein